MAFSKETQENVRRALLSGLYTALNAIKADTEADEAERAHHVAEAEDLIHEIETADDILE